MNDFTFLAFHGGGLAGMILVRVISGVIHALIFGLIFGLMRHIGLGGTVLLFAVLIGGLVWWARSRAWRQW